MTIENIKQIMDGVDIAALLPDISALVSSAAFWTRLAVLLGPIVLLFLGLHYFLLAPKEANYTTGYRFFWGMSSVEAWQFMQQLAGIIWSLLGMGLVIGMGVSVGGFEELEIMDLLWAAVKRIALQVELVLVSCLAINLVVLIRYDRKGKRRVRLRDLYEA